MKIPMNGQMPAAKVDGAVGHNRGTAGRPGGDQPFVAEDFAIRRAAAEFPMKPAGRGIQAIQVAVVGREENAVLPDGGGEADGAFREELPLLGPGLQVEGGDAVGDGRADEESVAENGGFDGGVELQIRLIGPGGFGWRKFAHPLQVGPVARGSYREDAGRPPIAAAARQKQGAGG